MMYKTHCQCILDNAINVNFEEVISKLIIFLSYNLDFAHYKFLFCAPDPKLSSSLLARDAWTSSVTAGESSHCGHLLRVWLYTLQSTFPRFTPCHNHRFSSHHLENCLLYFTGSDRCSHSGNHAGHAWEVGLLNYIRYQKQFVYIPSRIWYCQSGFEWV